MCQYSICTLINLQLSRLLSLPFASRSPTFVLYCSFALCRLIIFLCFHPTFISSFHPLTHPPVSLSLSIQCIRHITILLLQSQLSLQQPALKLMAESGDDQLLQLTLEQINCMTTVSVIIPVVTIVPLRLQTFQACLEIIGIDLWDNSNDLKHILNNFAVESEFRASVSPFCELNDT